MSPKILIAGIGAAVVFSSVAGRFGNSGQTDYSAANDLLCKVTSSLRAWRPATRGIAIDWTAWGGIGMATRGSIPKIMELAGIDMLPPEAGIPTVRRELTATAFSGEIVVGKRLGILTEEFDWLGGQLTSQSCNLGRERPDCDGDSEDREHHNHSGGNGTPHVTRQKGHRTIEEKCQEQRGGNRHHHTLGPPQHRHDQNAPGEHQPRARVRSAE